MKIIVTGSIGHISKPLTEELVQKGHEVTVISSNSDRQKSIEALGASAAIGTLEDIDFLTTSFTGADAVYTMVPPGNYFDPNLDLMAHYRGIAHNYAQAIQQANVKRVVNLSSIGAHLEKGNGILRGAYDLENTLNKLPSDVAITHLRPLEFYYNLYGQVTTIKSQGAIISNYGADDHLAWVSPKDIAAAVAEELTTLLSGRKIRYVASDELTGNETARILGEAIGEPDLKWIIISNEELEKNLVAVGMNPTIAAGLVEMYGSIHSGLLLEDYYQNKPALGTIKMTDFAKEFATAFN